MSRSSRSAEPLGYAMGMRYLLVGNYGVGNAGDEILREYFLERLQEVQWQVCSASPKKGELPRLPAGLRSLLSFRWLTTLKALKASDGMVFGGGSLFTDTESVSACWIWFVHAWFAVHFKKPVILAFQGIGPFKTRLGEWCARWVIKRASFISTRDAASTERVRVWKKSTEIVQSFDPSILLLEREKLKERTQNLLIYIPRFSTSKSEEKVTSFLKDWDGEVHVLTFHPSDKQLGITSKAVTSLRDVVEEVCEATVVLTERYHGAVLALACGVPFVAIRQRKGDKLDELAKLSGCPSIETAHQPSPASGGLRPAGGVSRFFETDFAEKKHKIASVKQECVRLAQYGHTELLHHCAR